MEKATKELDAIEANLGRMVPAERAMVRFHRAELEGRWLDALAALREWAALSEFPASFQLDIGLEELQVNRPAEAIRALSSLPVDWDALEYSMAHVPAQFLSIAYHMTHDYENELKVAREGQRRFPGVLPFYSAEAGALAALGRLDEIEKVIEACQAGQGGIRSGRPGLVMLTAARELRAHGYREASLRMAERAVAWFRARPAAEAAKYQEALMNALRWAERWAEAKPIAETLLAKDPDDVNLRGTIGCLAARLGDVTQARRIDGELAAITLPYMYGGQPYGRARIAAQLGEKDRAVTLLGDAFAQGKEFTWLIHVDIDLEPLWGYPPYEELMKPKG